MALIVKPNGTAVVEEPKATTTAAGAAVDSGNKVEDIAVNKEAASDAATSGIDIKAVEANLNTAYDSKYDDQLADLYNQIVQRKPFEYNADDDMLYQQYLQKYTQQGKQAMMDTIGQTAALTGGYGNSYSQRVGQETYDEYLRGLNDLLPQLQDAAYQRYNAEGDRLTQLYGLLGDMENRDMDRFRLNQTVNQGAYDRFMNEAALRGAAGDFGGYAEAFGQDSANKMAQIYNIDKLLPLVDAGLLSKDEYKQLLAPMLSELGIVTPKVVASGGDPWAYGGVGWNPGYMPGTSGGGNDDGGVDYVINSAGGVAAYDSNTGALIENIPAVRA